MTMNGVWTTQFIGTTGWENIGVLIMEDGRVRGGGRHHYVLGHYSASGNQVKLELHVEVHGKTQTFFGQKDTRFDMVGIVEQDGDTFSGSFHRPDVKQFDLFENDKREKRFYKHDL